VTVLTIEDRVARGMATYDALLPGATPEQRAAAEENVRRSVARGDDLRGVGIAPVACQASPAFGAAVCAHGRKPAECEDCALIRDCNDLEDAR
jgi:hypothetical protein